MASWNRIRLCSRKANQVFEERFRENARAKAGVTVITPPRELVSHPLPRSTMHAT